MSEQRIQNKNAGPVQAEELSATDVVPTNPLVGMQNEARQNPAAQAVSDIDSANSLIASLVEDIGKISEHRESDSATLELFRESMEVVNTQVFELRGYLTRIERNHEAQFKALQELIESQNTESSIEQTQTLLLGQLKTVIEKRFDALEAKLIAAQENQTAQESATGTRITDNQNALFAKLEQRISDALVPRLEEVLGERTQSGTSTNSNVDREIQELRFALQNTMTSLSSELSHNVRHVEHIARQTRASNENSDQASRWRLEMGSKVDALEHLIKEVIRELERGRK